MRSVVEVQEVGGSGMPMLLVIDGSVANVRTIVTLMVTMAVKLVMVEI